MPPRGQGCPPCPPGTWRRGPARRLRAAAGNGDRRAPGAAPSQHACPYRWTARTAAVRGPIAAATASGSISPLPRSTSTQTATGAGMLHRQRARDERVRRDDHLVAGADARRLQHDRQRRRARRDPDAVAHTAVGGKFGLELLDLLARGRTRSRPARGRGLRAALRSGVRAAEQGRQMAPRACAVLPHVGRLGVTRAPLTAARGGNAKSSSCGWEARYEKLHELCKRPRSRGPRLRAQARDAIRSEPPRRAFARQRDEWVTRRGS